MANLEDLFNLGTVSTKVEVKGVTFTVNLLNVRLFQDAMNASTSPDPTAQALEYKQQILARAISFINGEKFIEDLENPKNIEIEALLVILRKLHYSILNLVFDAYDSLENEISEEMAGTDKIKKSSTNRGQK